jgi:hypothetical protein
MKLVMGKVRKVTLRKRRNDWREFVIRAYDADGKRLPDCDYHTDDWDDAVETARAMNNVIAAETASPEYSI